MDFASAIAIVVPCLLLLPMTDGEMGMSEASVGKLSVCVAAPLGVSIAVDVSPQCVAIGLGRKPASDIARCGSSPAGSVNRLRQQMQDFYDLVPGQKVRSSPVLVVEWEARP